jgi:hypothetical protein
LLVSLFLLIVQRIFFYTTTISTILHPLNDVLDKTSYFIVFRVPPLLLAAVDSRLKTPFGRYFFFWLFLSLSLSCTHTYTHDII